MRVGIPKEIKTDEYRVGATPATVRELSSRGHQVLVETGAGLGIGIEDEQYKKSGAVIAADAVEVFSKADLVVKVKEPQEQEWQRLREGQILFTYLHLAADLSQAKGLLASGCSAIAYETVTDTSDGLPLLAPMSEVAGRLSIEAAAFSLRKPAGGMGKLVGGVPGVRPGKVVIIGGGVVGTQAARMAIGAGADVVILDRSLSRLRQLDDLFQARIKTRFSTLEAIDEEVTTADVVVGAVLIPGASAPKLLKRSQFPKMKAGCVLVDVAIDQGGCFETSRPTTHRDPVFTVDNIIHYCVANMPGAVPLTSTHALTNATLPYVLAIAADGIAATQNAHLRAGLNVHNGKITHRGVAESLGMEFLDPTVIVDKPAFRNTSANGARMTPQSRP